MGFTIDWTKDFIGKDALEAQRRDGLARRLCLFHDEGDALILHDEPIRENDTVVGLTTSGGRGARTGMTLALGLVSISPGESVDDTCNRAFEIDVAGRAYPARVLLRPPFDPAGERMRA